MTKTLWFSIAFSGLWGLLCGWFIPQPWALIAGFIGGVTIGHFFVSRWVKNKLK